MIFFQEERARKAAARKSKAGTEGGSAEQDDKSVSFDNGFLHEVAHIFLVIKEVLFEVHSCQSIM